jgi:hypothetical protein
MMWFAAATVIAASHIEKSSFVITKQNTIIAVCGAPLQIFTPHCVKGTVSRDF